MSKEPVMTDDKCGFCEGDTRDYHSCITVLRERIEKLEATTPPRAAPDFVPGQVLDDVSESTSDLRYYLVRKADGSGQWFSRRRASCSWGEAELNDDARRSILARCRRLPHDEAAALMQSLSKVPSIVAEWKRLNTPAEAQANNGPEEPQGSFEEQLVAHVRDWLKRSAKRINNGAAGATLEIRLGSAEWDDDGTLYLHAECTENRPADFEGRVEGIKDPQASGSR